MAIADVRELFVRELGDIYDAEHRLLEGQQEMAAQQASDAALEKALQRHIEQTEQHLCNLEQIYERVGHDPECLSSEVAQGLVNKAREDLQEAQGPAMRDCAINGAVIRVEYFEIGAYRRLLAGAGQLGQEEIVGLLEENLTQEEQTALTAEQSALELLRRAQKEAEQQQPSLVKTSESDFRLEERWQNIRELEVYDIDGEQVGRVEDLYVERDTRLPRFLVISAGGFLGMGKEHFLVPVEEVSREVSEERVTINQDRDKVMNLPEFDPDEMPEVDLQRVIYAYYGRR